MSDAAKISQEAQRYLQIAVTAAETIQQQLEVSIRLEDLIKAGAGALEEAVNTFRKGHGTSFRVFAHYRVSLAIYDFLSKVHWPNRALFNKYLFYRKSDELMDWHSRSAESIPKRTLDAEINELKKLLRVLIASAYLIYDQNEDGLINLSPNERDLLRLCFLQGVPMEQAALRLDMAKNMALRLQFQGLQNSSVALSLSRGETAAKENSND